MLLLVLLLHTGIVLVSSTKWHRLSFPEKEEKRLYLLIADIIDFFHRNNPIGYRLGTVVFLEQEYASVSIPYAFVPTNEFTVFQENFHSEAI